MSLGLKVVLYLVVWVAGGVPVAFLMFMRVGPCHSSEERVAAAQTIGGLWFLGLFIGPILIASSSQKDPPTARRARPRLPIKKA